MYQNSECDTEKGFGSVKCVNGYKSDECEFVTCKNGWLYNTTDCVEDPCGYYSGFDSDDSNSIGKYVVEVILIIGAFLLLVFIIVVVSLIFFKGIILLLILEVSLRELPSRLFIV